MVSGVFLDFQNSFKGYGKSPKWEGLREILLGEGLFYWVIGT